MYLREKRIKLLRIRNVLLTIICLIELFGRGFYIMSTIATTPKLHGTLST